MLSGVEKESLDMLSVFVLNGAEGAVALLEAELLNLAPRSQESRTMATPNGSADFFSVDFRCHSLSFYFGLVAVISIKIVIFALLID